MHTIDLNGEWELFFYPGGSHRIENPEQIQETGLKPVIARVPGNVELDLFREGILPDPFVGENIRKLKKYEKYEWWYRRTFSIPREFPDSRKDAAKDPAKVPSGGPRGDESPGRAVELVFHGVDCFAEYWLNGRRIGESANMFVEQRFDVSGLLSPGGENSLAVRLKSPLLGAAGREYDPSLGAGPTNWEHLWVRKAPHSYGWDIMPRVLSAGLWRGVEIIALDETEILDITFTTKRVHPGEAAVECFYRLQAEIDEPEAPGLQLRLTGKCGNSAFEARTPARFEAGSWEIRIDKPRLWWPRGYGEADLYDVTASLLRDGRVLAEKKAVLGIRTLELIRSETSDPVPPGSGGPAVGRPVNSRRLSGRNAEYDTAGAPVYCDLPPGNLSSGEFLFKVNGVPIFCKGSNWVPADAFHSRDASRYRDMLDLFRDLGCNILRCWGGNVYEDHLFFDLCDRYGIMVWQDFSMACARYPQETAFLETIRDEAAAVVRKLRNHPSLIVWCGDNECDQAYDDPSRNRITREVLPQIVFRCDLGRPYIPSSPYVSPKAADGKSKDHCPEQHLWGPRDYYKSRFYTEHTAHFVGEIGYHGCPNLSSIRRFIDEDHLWPWENNPQWILHGSDCIGEEGPYAYRTLLMVNQIRELFGEVPDSIEDFVVASQIVQAEAKKYFIEMNRLKKWRRTGVIWWNVIDGWPQFSDAIVDYYYGKKLAYQYIRRVQNPVCLMMDEPEAWRVRAVMGNDSRQDAEGKFRISDTDTGEVMLEGSYMTEWNRNADLGSFGVSRGDQKLFLLEWDAGGERFGSHYLLGSPPFSFGKYREWLEKLAWLPPAFISKEVGR